MFAFFGTEDFRGVVVVQVLFDLASWFTIAELARHLLSARAAKASFVLAAICLFLAKYAAAALTETLEIFFTALALDLAVRGLRLDAGHSVPNGDTQKPSRAVWFGCGLAVGAGILLRPDGGILLAAVGGYLLILAYRSLRSNASGTLATLRPILLAGALRAAGWNARR